MDNLLKLIEKMPKEVDAAIISDGINRRYFTNFCSTEGTVVVTKEKGYLLVDFRYYEMAKKSVKNVEVVCYSDLYEEIGKIFKNSAIYNVAVEINNTSVEQFKKYEDKLKGCHFLDDSWLYKTVLDLRSTKTEEEIEKIRLSQEVVDAAFSHILNIIDVDKTEKEIAREIENFILNNAQGLSFPAIVVSGKNTSLPHGRPSDKKLENGDFVTMDFGAILDGYCSDMTRTVCVKSPSDFQRELYRIVLNGQEKALKEIKKDLTCGYVDGLVRDYFKQFGYDEEFGHGLGHGVGLEIHEEPYLRKNYKTILKENAVVTVEPGLYLNSKMGLRIEDMVVVKENGILNLTKSSKELICV